MTTPVKRTFWVTFRLEKNTTYDTRLAALYEAIRTRAVEVWWKDPTSFIMFFSMKTIDELADAVKAVIDTGKDVVLIGMTEFQSFRLIGTSPEEDDLVKLIPIVQKKK